MLRALDPAAGWGAAGTLAFAGGVGASDFLAAWRRAHGRFDLEALESALPAFAALAVAGARGIAGGGFQSLQVILGVVALAVVLARFAAGLAGLEIPRRLATAVEVCAARLGRAAGSFSRRW